MQKCKQGWTTERTCRFYGCNVHVTFEVCFVVTQIFVCVVVLSQRKILLCTTRLSTLVYNRLSAVENINIFFELKKKIMRDGSTNSQKIFNSHTIQCHRQKFVRKQTYITMIFTWLSIILSLFTQKQLTHFVCVCIVVFLFEL